MSEPFLRVLFPGQARVCGRTLPPLTLWRLACLQAIRSPFLSLDAEEATFTLADLLLAIRAVRTPNQTPPNLRPRIRDVFTLLRFRKSRTYRENHGTRFLDWLALHQLRPELWQNEDAEARCISAPLILTQVAGLMDCGMSHADAWDTAPGYSSWLITSHAERQSDRIQFVSDDDDEIARAIEEQELRSEAEILAQAKLDLPPEAFERWVSARQKKTL
ncbi:hypothetical protein [Prosthecobacter sp.]|uniref:hypothetical protein n=1 Tax=Prosthecobacter sp. TaxID=1965333 RepID=UPI003783D94A